MFQRGKLYFLGNRCAEAVEDLSVYLEERNTDARAFMLRGQCYDMHGNLEAALKDYNAGIGNGAGDIAYKYRAGVYVRLGNYLGAIEDFNALISRYPDSSSLREERGDVYVVLERFDAAEADYKTALEILEEKMKSVLGNSVGGIDSNPYQERILKKIRDAKAKK